MVAGRMSEREHEVSVTPGMPPHCWTARCIPRQVNQPETTLVQIQLASLQLSPGWLNEHKWTIGGRGMRSIT